MITKTLDTVLINLRRKHVKPKSQATVKKLHKLVFDPSTDIFLIYRKT